MYNNVICTSNQNPAFVFFDERVSDTPESLTLMLNATMRYTRENIPVLLMCEAYCNSRKKILEAADCAIRGDETQAFRIFNELYEAHRREIFSLMGATECANGDVTDLLTCMNDTHENMRLLLSGVTRLKELSDKTSTLFMSMSASLAAYTVALYIRLSTVVSVHVVKTIDQMPNIFERSHVYVVRAHRDDITETCHVPDALAASYARQARVRVMDIWTHAHGVMTASPAYVANARPVHTLTYKMALEVAMLGGRVFHPLALQMLMQESIPIAIYSTVTAQYTTHITSSQENTNIPETVITNQNSCTICTVCSTDMFHRYGYVEKLFCICSQHGVSVETISTSEISVTMSFFTHACTDAFLSDLRILGDVRCYHDYSLISLISSSPWNSPQRIAYVLSSISEDISIETLSLGNNELSFSFAVKSVYLQGVMQSIHDAIYPSR